MTITIKRAERLILEHLEAADGWTDRDDLPGRNAAPGRASGGRLHNMRAAGLIEYGKAAGAGYDTEGYRISAAGRAALAAVRRA